MRKEKGNSMDIPFNPPKPEMESGKDQAAAISTQSAEAKAWQAENRDAIQAINDWVELNGIPLSEYRQF